jgi:hypothetical protein
MGPCLCGDPYCPSCGNPEAMRRMDEEVSRVEAAVGPDCLDSDCPDRVVCSCGTVLIDAEGTTRTLPRICRACWDEDHPEPVEPESDYGPVPDW